VAQKKADQKPKDVWIPLVNFNSKRTPDIIYTVSRRERDDQIGCNCPGWRFKRTCRHTEIFHQHGEAGALAMATAERPENDPRIEIVRRALRKHAERAGPWTALNQGLHSGTNGSMILLFIRDLDDAGFTKKPIAPAMPPGGRKITRMITLED
jgi:hypothetical protein